MRAMKRVSLKSGTPRMTHGSLVSNAAAMMGSAAFLLPLMVTSPCNGTPPLIKKLSMKRNWISGLMDWWIDGLKIHSFNNPKIQLLCFIRG
jgi:hypothetical protein